MSTVVTLSRELYLPRELVFDAWLQAEHVAQWYAPADATVEAVAIEPQPGGRFEIRWRGADGETSHHQSRFRTVSRPVGFECVFACGSADDGAAESAEARLRVSLRDEQDACTVDVRCEGLADSDVRHWRESWDARLDRLVSYFSSI